MFSNLEVAIHGCITLSLVHIKEAISKKQELPIPLFFFKKKQKKQQQPKNWKIAKGLTISSSDLIEFQADYLSLLFIEEQNQEFLGCYRPQKM